MCIRDRKSTFLRCLNLLEVPTSGEIWFEGKDITRAKTKEVNALRQKMGMVFQHFNLFPHLTILDNITLAPVKLNKMSKAEAVDKAMELLRRVGLEDKAKSYPNQLSGGQKQRIAIVRALAMNPVSYTHLDVYKRQGDDGQKAILSWGGKVSLFISDYGKLSRSRDRFVEFFENNGIDYRLKIYYGENQYFDGWIDNNNPHDLKEPGDVLEVNAKNCSQSRCKNMHCFDGKLYRCSNSCFMQEMGLFPPKKGDFVDLHDDTGRGEKREIIEQFYEYARRSCRYCKFKYQAVLPRYAAAKQLLGVRND